MKIAPMLSVGPLKGLEFISPTQTTGLLRASDLHHPHQHNRQSEDMEDLSEMFTLATWPDINGMNKFPWDHHSGAALNAVPHLHHSPNEMFTAAQINQQQLGLCDSSAIHGSSNVSPASDPNISASHAQRLISRRMQESAALDSLRRIREGSCRALGFINSSSGGSSNSDHMAASTIRSRSSAPLLPTWHQAYMGGASSSCPLGLGPAEALMLQADGSVCGITQDDNAQAGLNEGMLIPICGAQVQQRRTAGQQPLAQVPVSRGISAPSYSSHTGIGQPQGAAAVVAGTARPRVRARRGQATDPHSIAERLRRERIADRMKALQELVPNANKTDKASMLDEIIEYVRFLQLQVKILSMSRLTGTGAVAPLVTDMPGEGFFHLATTALIRGGGATSSSQDDTMATERQVARLMEESMGSALQFLQSRGLCLIPISLATVMSSSISARPATGSSHGKTEASSTSIWPPSSAGFALSVHCTSDMVTDEVSSATNASIHHSLDTMMQHGATAPNVLKSTIKPLANITKIN